MNKKLVITYDPRTRGVTGSQAHPSKRGSTEYQKLMDVLINDSSYASIGNQIKFKPRIQLELEKGARLTDALEHSGLTGFWVKATSSRFHY